MVLCQSGLSELDQRFLGRTLELAHEAFRQNEVPVGALVSLKGEIVSEAYNQKERDQNSLHHAEVLALQRASKKLGRWRLSGCSLYVSLEPCVMCAGTLVASRIERVAFAAFDPKGGGLGSLYSLHKDKRLNHQFEVACENGLIAQQSAQLLKQFFAQRRQSPPKDLGC